MRLIQYFLFVIVWALLVGVSGPTSTPGSIQLTSPAPGEVLQGVATIEGTTTAPGFVSVDVSFAYSHNKTGDWFLIRHSQQPVQNGAIATWDTTTITDGDYDLRVVVTLADGTQQQVNIAGLRVRNYSPIESSTPAPSLTQGATHPIQPTRTVTAIPVATATHAPTMRPLPANPAILSEGDLLGSLAKGGLVLIGLLLLTGMYQALRSFGRR